MGLTLKYSAKKTVKFTDYTQVEMEIVLIIELDLNLYDSL